MKLNKEAIFPVKKCQYGIRLSFSLFDILTGEELTADHIYINDVEIDTAPQEIDGRYYYNIETESSRVMQLKITKEFKHILIRTDPASRISHD